MTVVPGIPKQPPNSAAEPEKNTEEYNLKNIQIHVAKTIYNTRIVLFRRKRTVKRGRVFFKVVIYYLHHSLKLLTDDALKLLPDVRVNDGVSSPLWCRTMRSVPRYISDGTIHGAAVHSSFSARWAGKTVQTTITEAQNTSTLVIEFYYYTSMPYNL